MTQACDICVWMGGDRPLFNLWDRLNGHVAAIKPEGWPYTINEWAGNHRVIRVHNATIQELLFLRKQTIQWYESRPGFFQRQGVARCGVLLPEHVVETLKALPWGEILEIDKAFLLKDLRVAPDAPTIYMTEQEKADWYVMIERMKIQHAKKIKRKRLNYWRTTTFLRAA